MDRDGGVIIEDLFAPEVVAGLLRDLTPVLGGVEFGREEFFAGARTRRAGALFARTDGILHIARNPLYLGLSRHILQKPVDVWFGTERTTITPDIQIGVTQAIQIAPGQGAQPLHRDDTSFLWRHPHYGREARVQIMVALSEFTAGNGGTLVIPGSHRWDDERMPSPEEAVATEMTPGSALVWVGSTYHGGGTNTSDTLRTGITMGYDLASLRQEENQYLSVPLSRVRALPEEVQRMLGWSSGRNFMGWVEVNGQMIDPHALLARDDHDMAGGLPPAL
ncbi:phytanoyl-CoA dioxygenase family protein [Streptomyces sp. SID8352]|nr:phytanoyl-CoA dioxygenase family protein [Streptomyces sp. SID8352]MYU22613.1 phytanoyl-CoA dioxygenase family protein [Streptomyces sp. SID8352]